MKFDEGVALAKKAGEEEGLAVRTIERHLCIPFASFGCADKVVNSLLNLRLNKFSRKANGVLLAVGNVRMVDTSGMLMAEQPVFHLNLLVDTVVFSTTIGHLHQATVTEVREWQLKATLFDQISVTVKAPEGSKLPKNIQVGDAISFKVVSISQHSKNYFLTAHFDQLIKKGSGKAGKSGSAWQSRAVVDPFRLLDEYKKKGATPRKLTFSSSHQDVLEEEPTIDSKVSHPFSISLYYQ